MIELLSELNLKTVTMLFLLRNITFHVKNNFIMQNLKVELTDREHRSSIRSTNGFFAPILEVSFSWLRYKWMRTFVERICQLTVSIKATFACLDVKQQNRVEIFHSILKKQVFFWVEKVILLLG